jgi:hypothetical protein
MLLRLEELAAGPLADSVRAIRGIAESLPPAGVAAGAVAAGWPPAGVA